MAGEQQQDAPASREERFFGVRHTIGTKAKDAATEGGKGGQGGEGDDEFSIEIVDDLPKQPPKEGEGDGQKAKGGDADDDDDELSQYSESVKKRINKLTYERSEAERQRQAAEQMRDEAVRAAQELTRQRDQYQSVISRGEAALLSQIKERAKTSLEQAKATYRQAYEKGDTDKMLESQEAMNRAQFELHEVEGRERSYRSRQREQDHHQQGQPAQHQQPPQQPYNASQDGQQGQQQPELDERQKKWAENNPWFFSEDHPDMKALAYGVHEKLTKREGVSPNSDEYYERIDAAMRERFPDYFKDEQGSQVHIKEEGQGQSQKRQPGTVVAPGGRNNGSSPRTVTLTATQAALARRLGLTPEQYAMQLVKEMKSNG